MKMEQDRPPIKEETHLEHSNILHQTEITKSQFVLSALFANFTYAKKFAIKRLCEKTAMKLDTLFCMYQSGHSCEEIEEAETHNVFSWTMEDFRKRCDLTSFVWIDVMLRISDVCLNDYKFKKDLEQLQYYLKRVFDGFLAVADNDVANIEETVIKPIKNIVTVLTITYGIEEELKKNKKKYWEVCQKDTFIKNVKRESMDHMKRLLLEKKLMNSHIWMPIELRYHLEWYNCKVNQVKHYHECILDAREKDIIRALKKIEMEKKVNASCLDFYQITIVHLKNQLAALQAKFEREYDDIDYRIIVRSARLTKMREQWEFQKDELKRFQVESEVHIRRQQQEAEEKAAKEEKERLEKLEALEASAKATKAKGKIGNKTKLAKNKTPSKSNMAAKAVSPKTPAKNKKK